MFIDTHSHLYLGALSEHIPEAVKRLEEQNFSHAIQIGTSVETSKTCIELARKYPILRATVGIHPCEAQDISAEKISEQIAELEEMILKYGNCSSTLNSKLETQNFVVGLGEIGFDHYHLSQNPEESALQKSRQIEWFHAQAKLAMKYDLPVVIHTRNCADLTLENIKKSGLKKFVIHCFSEDIAFAREVMEYSDEAKISFTGILTYPKAFTVQETAKGIPLEKIMIETDAPYLIPEALKGKVKYCEPAYSKYVFEKLCELRSESPEVIEEQIWKNSVDFFQL